MIQQNPVPYVLTVVHHVNQKLYALNAKTIFIEQINQKNVDVNLVSTTTNKI